MTTTPNPAELAAARLAESIASNADDFIVMEWCGNEYTGEGAEYPRVHVAALREIILRDLASGLSAGAEVVPPLDDARLQELFSSTIMGAIATGAQGNNHPPEGHWLTQFWRVGWAYQNTSPLLAAPAATPPAEKEVRAAAQTVITARLRFGWSPEVDEAIAVLEKALEGEKEVRVPLTHDQFEAIWVAHGLDECDPEGFARAIERAHGIQGEGA